MNITIKLSDAQVKGIKDYIRETEGTGNYHITGDQILELVNTKDTNL